jgi:hypothetical protein
MKKEIGQVQEKKRKEIVTTCKLAKAVVLNSFLHGRYGR